ncbi:MAG: hypothetical protein ABIJ56_22775 [Pseudomonadota bacterium]
MKKHKWLHSFQGIARSELSGDWIVTTSADRCAPALKKSGKIIQFPASHGLPQKKPADTVEADIPKELRKKGYNHPGDPDWAAPPDTKTASPFLFVPLEAMDRDRVPLVLVYRDTADEPLQGGWNSVPLAANTKRNEAPWLAVQPGTGVVFTSQFHMNSACGWLRAYVVTILENRKQVAIDCGTEVPLYDRDGRPINIGRIQGGDFSPGGDLYLLAEAGDHGPGIYMFEMEKGSLTGFIPVGLSRSLVRPEEFEGLTYGDTGGFQLHAVLKAERITHVLLTFKHWNMMETP